MTSLIFRRRIGFCVAFLLSFTLSFSAGAVDRITATKPARRDTTPFPVAAIIDQLRKLSGDNSYARAVVATVPANPPAPAPANPPAPAPVTPPAPAPANPPAPAPANPPAPAPANPPAPAPAPTVPDAGIAPPPAPNDNPSGLVIHDSDDSDDSDDLDVPDVPDDLGGDDIDSFASMRKAAQAKAPPADEGSPLDQLNRAKQQQLDQLRNAMHRDQQNYRSAVEEQNARWLAEFQAQRERWLADRDRFLNALPMYRAQLRPIMATPGRLIPKAPHTNVPKDIAPDAFVLVNGATEVPIHDQKNRGTCAAFAGVRALEVVARSGGREVELSEQYFYWSSKPACQDTPCGQGGSWVSPAYEANLAATDLVIPDAASCPYNPDPVDGNDTQTPLAAGCLSNGALRLAQLTSVWSMPDVLRTLDEGRPVVVASTLTENFFTTTGVVTQADSLKEETRDSIHAGGHAYLAVGYLALPASLQPSEGKYCLLVANSWGEGWGAGGYACVTETWFKQHRFDQDFLAPAEVWVRSATAPAPTPAADNAQ